jgi:hypothetical protein
MVHIGSEASQIGTCRLFAERESARVYAVQELRYSTAFVTYASDGGLLCDFRRTLNDFFELQSLAAPCTACRPGKLCECDIFRVKRPNLVKSWQGVSLSGLLSLHLAPVQR